MKKQYMAPATTMVAVAPQQMIAVSGSQLVDKRLSTVEAAEGWTKWEIKDVTDAELTLIHGQSSDGGGSRAKGSAWDEWDD